MTTMSEQSVGCMELIGLSASEKLTKLEQQFKTDKKVFVPLLEACLAAGKPGRAINLIRSAPNADKDPHIRVLLAQAYFDSFQNDSAKQLLNNINQLSPNSCLAQRLLGELALDDNKPDLARQYLHKAYALDNKDPQTVALLRGLGENIPEVPLKDDNVLAHSIVAEVLDRETLPTALLHVGIAIAVCSIFFGVYKWRVDVAYQAAALVMEARPTSSSGDVNSINETIQTYEKVLQLDSDNEYALSGLAEAHALLFHEHGMKSHKDKAKAYLEQCHKKGIEKAESYMAEGLLLLEENRYPEVKKLAENLIIKGATDERLLYLAGLSARFAGDTEVALQELRKAVDISSKTPLYTITLADAYYWDADDRNAQFFWGKAGIMNAGHPVARARSLQAQVAQGKAFDDIARGLTKLEAQVGNIDAPKDQIAVDLAWAELYLRDSQPEQALARIEHALSINAKDPLSLETKGRILLAQGKANHGLEILQEALVVYPTSRRVIMDIVNGYLQTAAYDKAMTTLEKLAAKDEESNVDYHIKRGDILLAMALSDSAKRTELFENAQGSYNRALHINQSYAPAYYSLGYLMQAEGKLQEAANYYEKAVELRERYPEVYRQMGLMFAKLGDMDAANQWLDDAEKMFLQNRKTTRQTMSDLYIQAVKSFAAAGARGKKYEKIWQQKGDNYNK